MQGRTNAGQLRRIFRGVISASVIAPIAGTVGFVACGGSVGETPGETDGGGGTSDGSIAVDAGGPKKDGGVIPTDAGGCATGFLMWNKPGCGANEPPPVCLDAVLNCYSVVCSCDNKVISGCQAYGEPWSGPISFGPGEPPPKEGSPCNTGCVDPPQPAPDAGFTCAPFTVPYPCSFPLADGGMLQGQDCQKFCGSNAWWCSRDLSDGGALLRCDPGCAIGRRPEDFTGRSSRVGSEATITGRYFAAVAELEAASVFSFERLASELATHGAPRALRRRAQRAAADERRHARMTASLAKRFGGECVEVTPAPSHVRSLEAIALENAVEGCVRETFGALVATMQATRAEDAKVRAAMRTIAADETRHASLAWAVAEWLDTCLDERVKARVRAAKARAIEELRSEMCIPQPSILQRLAGLPESAEAARMLDEMRDTLWAA
jgi:hypothetical protein